MFRTVRLRLSAQGFVLTTLFAREAQFEPVGAETAPAAAHATVRSLHAPIGLLPAALRNRPSLERSTEGSWKRRFRLRGQPPSVLCGMTQPTSQRAKGVTTPPASTAAARTSKGRHMHWVAPMIIVRFTGGNTFSAPARRKAACKGLPVKTHR